MAVVASGFIFQPLIGVLLDFLWPSTNTSTITIYTVQEYRLAMIVIPAIFIVSFIVSLFFIKETYFAKK
jgi:hypothetical protein